MSGLYRGFMWAYLGGFFAGLLIAERDDYWWILPVALVTVMAFTRRVA